MTPVIWRTLSNSSVTLTSPAPETAVLPDYDASFVSVDNIKLGQYYSFDNIPVLSDTIDSSKKLIYAGSCAILELSGEALAQSVTITFSCDSPINISEIVVLGVG